MYTLEEINETARAKGIGAFWKIFLFFGVGFPVIGIGIMMLFAPSGNVTKESTIALLLSILLPCLICGLLAGAIVNILVSVGVKKKMKEENEAEEQANREDHYKRMEELLEKMTKEKENA